MHLLIASREDDSRNKQKQGCIYRCPTQYVLYARLLTAPISYLIFKFELIRNGYLHGDNLVTPFGGVEA